MRALTTRRLPWLPVLLCAAALAQPKTGEWQSMFDGKTLQGWRETAFTLHGKTRVENGTIVLAPGAPMTGVTWSGAFPKSDYEVRFEAARIDGNDGREWEVKRHQVHIIGDGAVQEPAAGEQGAVALQVETILPGRLLQVQRVDGGIAEVEQILAFRGNQDGQMARRVTGRGNGGDAGHDFGFAVDGLDLVAQHAEAAARHGVDGLLGRVGHAERTQVGAGGGPELPFDFGKHVAGVGEGGAPAQVDGAADVVGVGVGENHGIDILGADAGHFQARLDGAGSAGGFTGPGIDQDDMTPGFDEQAGIRAKHAFQRETMAFHGAVQFGGVGVGEEPGRRVGVVAVAEHSAPDGADLEAMRTLWHM
jgi:hypothetical protein